MTNPLPPSTSTRRPWLMALLFLLLSLSCVWGASQGALWFIDRSQIRGSMRTNQQADYSPGAVLRLNPLNRDRMLAEIEQDEHELQSKPELSLAGLPLLVAVPEPTMPFPTPSLPTPPPTFTPSPSPTPTLIPSPTPTLVPTRAPAQPTTAKVAPSPTTLPLPPTLPSPSPVAASPTTVPTSAPAPATSVPTSTPTPVTSVATSTPTPPTPTPPPTIAPTSTNTASPSRPPQLADDAATTAEDTLLIVNVLANDSAGEGQLVPATLTVIEPPAHGSSSVNPTTGEISFTPVGNYYGSDRLSYQVCNEANRCAQARLYLTVTPVNDPPSLADDSGLTDDDLSLTLDVLANDSDVDGEIDPASVAVVTAPLSGTVAVHAGSGQITYTPYLQADGLDSFVYTACDIATPVPACATATVRVDVTAAPRVPLVLLAAPGDSQVDLGWTSTLGAGEADYQLYRDGTLLTTVIGTDYLDTALTNDQTYSYTVRALNNAGRVIGLSNLALAQPYRISVPYTPDLDCQGSIQNCNEAQGGPPDGDFAQILPGSSIVFDFGTSTGLINGPGYDLVLYDRENPPGSGEVQIDFAIVEVSADGVDWITVFAWDGQPGGVQGTNVDRHATIGPDEPDGEVDDERIPTSELYNDTGIAIDLAPWTPPGLSFPFVRLRHPDPNGSNPVDVDAIERLN